MQYMEAALRGPSWICKSNVMMIEIQTIEGGPKDQEDQPKNKKLQSSSSMIMVFKYLQVGQDSTVVTSFCVQLAALWARVLWTDVNNLFCLCLLTSAHSVRVHFHSGGWCIFTSFSLTLFPVHSSPSPSLVNISPSYSRPQRRQLHAKWRHDGAVLPYL